MIDILLIIGGFAILIWGANLLVDSSSSLAKKLNIPSIVIGLTIVAFGTSSPELVVNIFAAVSHNSDIALGNIMGSNIFNILGILGISAIICPLAVKSKTTWIEIPLSLLAALVVLTTANDVFLNKEVSSVISRSEGIIYLFFFIIFLIYNIQLARGGKSDEVIKTKNYSPLKAILLIITGLGLLAGGGRIIVYSAINLARFWGISERVIALTVISIGTSLPELATSVVAAIKKNLDIVIGNIVGSNIFNIFLILGISAAIYPVRVLPISQLDILVNIVASILLFIFVFIGKGRKLERFEGIIFVCLYISYLFVLTYNK